MEITKKGQRERASNKYRKLPDEEKIEKIDDFYGRINKY